MTAVIEAQGISAGYGPLPAIREIDLVLHSGQVVALLGANGAGKTTVLRVLAGALLPSRGTVKWRGAVVRQALYQRARKGLRFVTEERSVFMSLTVLENLRLGGGSIEHALSIFPDLKDLLRRKAGLLSGGEQQMLTLARALSSRPEALLADELSLGLAPIIVARLLRTIRTAADEGTAVLLVEQEIRAALEVADWAYVMRRGQILLSGSTEELRGRTTEIEALYLTDHKDLEQVSLPEAGNRGNA